MLDLYNKRVLITGAAGGIGPHLARRFAQRGARLVLSALPDSGVADVADDLRAAAVEADLTRAAEVERLATAAVEALGGVDVLVNNAGVEMMRPFERLGGVELATALAVNLAAPMQLTRLLLPAMLERRLGHVVNVASLAGKAAPAHMETYSATKAGLIAFTRSLRATYRGRGVSASVVCPGFVRAGGMYQRAHESLGVTAPRLMGTTSPTAVADAAVRVVERDLPEAIVNRGPVRLLVAAGELFPELGPWLLRRSGVEAMTAQWAAGLAAPADGTEVDAPPAGRSTR
ncbi:MAG: SDR family NAD(P)-dependent oxidoreductase [Gemmatimonadaceae bacterium]